MQIVEQEIWEPIGKKKSCYTLNEQFISVTGLLE